MSKNDIKRKIISDLRAINPKKIILFGSFAEGKFVEGESDIDLLIINNTQDTHSNPSERYSQARLALTLDYPFDIFVLTQDELKSKLKVSFFFREIVDKGEVIYEQN